MNSTASAQVEIPASTMSQALRATAHDMGLTLVEQGETLSLRLALGTLTMTPKGAGVALDLAAVTPAKLQTLRDTVAERLGNAAPGLTVRWSYERGTTATPANVAVTRIARVERLSPSYFRVRLEGDLERFVDPADGLHFKLLLSDDGTLAPGLDQNGVTDWPGGIKAWHRPVYTMRAMDPAGGWLDFDVFVHDGGRVTQWCMAAQVGDQIAISGPNGGGLISAPNVLLIGDETAVPVVARMLENAPEATTGKAILFVPDQEDSQPISAPAGIAVQWVLRGADETPLDALQGADLPAAERFVFFAAERSESQAARTWLTQQGLGRGEFRTASYWTRSA